MHKYIENRLQGALSLTIRAMDRSGIDREVELTLGSRNTVSALARLDAVLADTPTVRNLAVLGRVRVMNDEAGAQRLAELSAPQAVPGRGRGAAPAVWEAEKAELTGVVRTQGTRLTELQAEVARLSEALAEKSDALRSLTEAPTRPETEPAPEPAPEPEPEPAPAPAPAPAPEPAPPLYTPVVDDRPDPAAAAAATTRPSWAVTPEEFKQLSMAEMRAMAAEHDIDIPLGSKAAASEGYDAWYGPRGQA